MQSCSSVSIEFSCLLHYIIPMTSPFLQPHNYTPLCHILKNASIVSPNLSPRYHDTCKDGRTLALCPHQMAYHIKTLHRHDFDTAQNSQRRKWRSSHNRSISVTTMIKLFECYSQCVTIVGGLQCVGMLHQYRRSIYSSTRL